VQARAAFEWLRGSRAAPLREVVLAETLLVEGLGVGGGGGHVGVAGRFVGAGGELQLIDCLEGGVAGRTVGGGIILEIEKKGEHGAGTRKVVGSIPHDQPGKCNTPGGCPNQAPLTTEGQAPLTTSETRN